MRDINDIMPKIPNMKWGALTNKYPTNKNVKELDKMLPHDKKWHTVFDFDDQVYVDDVQIWKKDKSLDLASHHPNHFGWNTVFLSH